MRTFRFLRPERDRERQYARQEDTFILRSIQPLRYLWFPYQLLYFFVACAFGLAHLDSLYSFVESFTPDEYNFAAFTTFSVQALLIALPLLTLAALPFHMWRAYRELWSLAEGWPGPSQVYFTDYLSRWRKRWEEEVVVPNQRLAAAAADVSEKLLADDGSYVNTGHDLTSLRRQCFFDLAEYIPQSNVPYAMSGVLETDHLPDYQTSTPEVDQRVILGAVAYTVMERVPQGVVFYDTNTPCLVVLLDLPGTGPSIEHKIMLRLFMQGAGESRRLFRRTRYLAVFFEGRYQQSENFSDGSYHYEGDWKHLERLNAFGSRTHLARIGTFLLLPLSLAFFLIRLANPFNVFSFLKLKLLSWPYAAYREYKYEDITETLRHESRYHTGDFADFWLLWNGIGEVDSAYSKVAHPTRNEYLEKWVKRDVDTLHTALLKVISEVVRLGPQTSKPPTGGGGLNTV